MKYSIAAGNLKLSIDSETRMMSVVDANSEFRMENAELNVPLKERINMCVETFKQNDCIRTWKGMEAQVLEMVKNRIEIVYNKN